MRVFLCIILLICLSASAGEQPIAVRGTNGVARGITLAGAITNSVVGATKIIGTDAQSREKGVVLSGLTWDGTTLALYAAPTITSFVNDHPSVEIGSTVSDTVLDWTLGGGAITSQSLNQGIGALAIGLRTYADPANYTTTRTYTLTVGDGTTTVQANSSVTVLNKAYWGVSSETSLTDVQIRALAGQELTLVRQREVLLSPAQQYVYFAWPANSSAGESFGAGTFTVGGLDFDAITPTTRAFQNATLNHTEDYIIYRSNNLLDSTFTFAVQ